MKTGRKFRRMKLNEISVVDNPAQEGALARIMKGATEEELSVGTLTKAQAAAYGRKLFADNVATEDFQKCVNDIRVRAIGKLPCARLVPSSLTSSQPIRTPSENCGHVS